MLRLLFYSYFFYPCIKEIGMYDDFYLREIRITRRVHLVAVPRIVSGWATSMSICLMLFQHCNNINNQYRKINTDSTLKKHSHFNIQHAMSQQHSFNILCRISIEKVKKNINYKNNDIYIWERDEEGETFCPCKKNERSCERARSNPDLVFQPYPGSWPSIVSPLWSWRRDPNVSDLPWD